MEAGAANTRGLFHVSEGKGRRVLCSVSHIPYPPPPLHLFSHLGISRISLFLLPHLPLLSHLTFHGSCLIQNFTHLFPIRFLILFPFIYIFKRPRLFFYIYNSEHNWTGKENTAWAGIIWTNPTWLIFLFGATKWYCYFQVQRLGFICLWKLHPSVF